MELDENSALQDGEKHTIKISDFIENEKTN